MIKTLTFGDKQVSFSTSFSWTFFYEAQFHKDAAQVIVPVMKSVMSDTEASDEDSAYVFFEKLGFTGIANMAWAMARVLDQSIPDPITWVSSFGDDFDMTAIVNDLLPEAMLSCMTSKKSSVPIPAETKKTAPKTTKK